MKKLAGWIKDYAYLFPNGIFSYLKHTPPKHYLEYTKQGKAPVVILPGVLMRWAFYKKMADHISLLGHPVYIIPKLGNNIEEIPGLAKKAREVIYENNLKNVVMVAHSKGGLVGKYILLHEDPEKRVQGLVAVATPFHGSALAKFIPHPSVREISPNAKIINYLKNHSEVNNKIVSIYPVYDNHVWHPKGSYLEGALQNVKVEIYGHHKILSDKKIWNVVVKWIEKLSYS